MSDIAWLAEVTFPYDTAMSKNRNVRFAKGHAYTPSEHKALRDALVLLIRQRMRGVKLFLGQKVWLDIYVEKPNNRSDALNVLDFVADAVKQSIEIDDRWYSVARLDWELKKDNPQLRVRIGQERLD